MDGADAPIRKGQHVGLVGEPFAGHAGAKEYVINARITVLLGIIMGPGDVARFPAGGVVAVALGGAGVNQLVLATANERLDGGGILVVVKVAEDDEIGVGVGGKAIVNLLAQEFGFFETELGFVGLGDRTPGF